MSSIEPPRERECERCPRREVWDEDRGIYTAASDDDRGTPYCVHEWDVTGTYNPV
jgi:hypothetical protein